MFKTENIPSLSSQTDDWEEMRDNTAAQRRKNLFKNAKKLRERVSSQQFPKQNRRLDFISGAAGCDGDIWELVYRISACIFKFINFSRNSQISSFTREFNGVAVGYRQPSEVNVCTVDMGKSGNIWETMIYALASECSVESMKFSLSINFDFNGVLSYQR